ncbi:hypothetical protein [Vibrio vulnificus]|uniref:hypothetical protein n=1 Tax=Vibrio vulnificus TaxID=672 RepID=UPI003EDA0F62
MYLIKLASGVYYTRIATPVFLQNSHDYPKEVRFSLLTKTRLEAIKRNTRLASAICSTEHSISAAYKAQGCR